MVQRNQKKRKATLINKSNYRLQNNFERKIAKLLSSSRKCDFDLNVLLTDDEGIRKLNQEFKKKKQATDVLAFESYDQVGADRIVDIAISVDTARVNAKRFGVTIKNEIYRYVLHGILHVVGYRDGTLADKKIMQQKEDELLFMIKE